MHKLHILLKGWILLVFALGGTALTGQDQPPTYKPLVVKLNPEGDQYLRFIMWHQVWMTTNDLSQSEAPLRLSTSIRRSRFLAYAQVSPRFLILTHFGLNGLDGGNLTSLGNNGDAAQLFLHGAWTEFMAGEGLYIGAGLHYWKGLTRLANASTLNFMTLDQSRPFVHWHSLGITDQFARHLGIYAKGQLGNFDYRVAINTPGRRPLGDGRDYGGNSSLTYTGVSTPEITDANPAGIQQGNTLYEGYFRYNFWDKESTKLPYQVGSYLGEKKVLGIGAGFFSHPNGMYDQEAEAHKGVFHFAFDAFLDLPTAAGGLTAYAAFMQFDYGDRYLSRWAGTGSVLYGQAGYFIRSARIMPYLAFQSGNYEALDQHTSALDVGINYFVMGHHAKLTLEYHTIRNDPRETTSQIRMQAHIFL